jgi:HKD family nuclease
MKWTLIAQGGDKNDRLDISIKNACSGLIIDRLDVAVAYATLQGVKSLSMAFNGIPPQSRWVVGLDDAISQPKAIEYLVDTKGSNVRLASLAPAKRFHPKIYTAWSSKSNKTCVSAIGSGNMTLNGMRNNGETAVILSAENDAEADRLKLQWEVMWNLGKDVTPKAIADYKIIYDKAKKFRKNVVDLGASPPEPEPVDQLPSYNGNPASGQTAWLEAGTPSAGGRDLEFPKAMMPFFGLSGSVENRTIKIAKGGSFLLTFTERLDNQMWRLLFSSASIQSAIGRDTMRPNSKTTRSDLIVVFQKIAGSKNLLVDLVKIGGQEHLKLRVASQAVNGLFKTRNPGGREFGFI